MRNKAAHVIISITDEWIYKKIGFNSETIISKINEALTYTNVKTGIGFFESYDKMNEMLINALKK